MGNKPMMPPSDPPTEDSKTPAKVVANNNAKTMMPPSNPPTEDSKTPANIVANNNAKTQKKEKGKKSNMIDLLFVLDTTGSMGSYIASAQSNIKKIVAKTRSDQDAHVRFGLVSYKDYNKGDTKMHVSKHTAAPNPPEAKLPAKTKTSRGMEALARTACKSKRRPRSRTPTGGNGFSDGSAARVYDFTDDVLTMQRYIDCQKPTGGGDGPEAVATALHCAEAMMNWRADAVKIAVFITDAPPHGVENSGDNFPDGDPDCRDCLAIARALADKDITVYTVACEPSVTNSFTYCRDFLEGVAEITGGMLVPLKSADMLTDMILASCKEGADLEKVQAAVQAALAQAKADNPSMSGQVLADCAAKKLAAAGVRVHHTRETANAYANFDRRNVTLFSADAASLKACKKSLAPVSAPKGWDRGLQCQQIRSEVACLSSSQCHRMMKKRTRKSGWGF